MTNSRAVAPRRGDDVVAAAREYLKRGWRPVPIPHRSKGPTHAGWHKIRVTHENVAELFGGGRLNIGLQMGQASGGLCDVDLDAVEAVKLGPLFLAPTTTTFGRESKPASHWLYISDLAYREDEKAAIKYAAPASLGGDNLIELRIGAGDKGTQTLAPPSVHPSGERVRWDEQGEEPAQIAGDDLKQVTAGIAAASLLLRCYPSRTRRHDCFLTLGGFLTRTGATRDNIQHFVGAIARTADDEEWQDRIIAAGSAVDAANLGVHVAGLPKMRETWGEELANTVAKWLNIAADTGQHQARPKQADTLIGIAEHAELFRTRDDKAFADIRISSRRETWAVRSSGFRKWLLHTYFKEHKSTPSSEALKQAIDTIEARAQFEAPTREVFVRVGAHEGRIYIDVGDQTWRAIEVSADGWCVIDAPPLRFRRAATMVPLPLPARGGSIELLHRYLNIATDNDFVLLVSWLLATLRPHGPFPILVLLGEDGTGKSVVVEVLRLLTDPNAAPLRSLPREDHDLFIAATNGHVLGFDNISSVPQWLSDALCRLATGGGFAVPSCTRMRTRSCSTQHVRSCSMAFRSLLPVLIWPTVVSSFICAQSRTAIGARKRNYSKLSSAIARAFSARCSMPWFTGYAPYLTHTSNGYRAWLTSRNGHRHARLACGRLARS
jgi:hypothetical protein